MALHEAHDGHHGGAQKAMGSQDDGLKVGKGMEK